MDKISAVRSFIPELILLIVLGILFAVNVNVFDIDPSGELFHIEAAKETLGNGHFWLPVLEGKDYLTRAPFWIWIVTLCFKTLGVSLWVARIPAVICAMLGLVLIYMLSMELTKSRFSAFFAAGVLGTSWGYFQLGTLSTADILTTDLYLAFAWALVQWHASASRRHSIPVELNVYSGMMGGLLGLLILAKGTSSVLFLLVLMLVFIIVNDGLDLLRRLNFSLFLLPLVLIPLPWLIGASIGSGNPSFIWQYLISNPMEKFTGTGLWAGLQHDWLFYLKQLLLDWMPYWLFLPGLLMNAEIFHRRGAANVHWALWMMLWFLFGFLLCSLSCYQEATMMLPFYPPLAILVGYYLGQVMEGNPGDMNLFENTVTGVTFSLMGIAVLMAILIFQVIPSDYVNGFWHLPGTPTVTALQLGKHLIDLPEAFPIWKFWLIPGPFVLLIGGLTIFILQAGRRLNMAPMAVLSTFVVFLLFVKLVYLPILNRPIAASFAHHINQQAKAGDKIVLYSLHPDVKRVWFYLNYNKQIPVHFLRDSAAMEKTLSDSTGTVFGVIREKSYFNDLAYNYRYRLRVNQFDWKWDTNRLHELKKFLIVRPPLFEKMKSDVIAFQSLPNGTLSLDDPTLDALHNPDFTRTEKTSRSRR